MKHFDWTQFKYYDSEGDRPFLPAICCFFYFAADVHDAADDLANGIDRYIDYVSLNALNSYVASSGNWKAMTKAQLTRNLKHLRNFPTDHKGIRIEYDSGKGGEPGEYGVNVAATEYGLLYEKRTSALRLDFPPQWLESNDLEEFLAFVAEITQLETVQSANVGLTFKSTSGSERYAIHEVLRMLPRYLGFSPCYRHFRDEMLGRTFRAHWLNFVNDELIASLGGSTTIKQSLPNCEVRTLRKGILIRGAKLPPVGDINRKAPDLGSLPEVARLLKPTRIDISKTGLAFASPDFDAVAWMERLDGLKARPWDNTNAF